MHPAGNQPRGWISRLESYATRGNAKLRRLLFTTCLVFLALSASRAQEKSLEIQDITGKYHFLSADDTLAILEEEGKLKGYVDVLQSEEESDTVLSFPLLIGWRKKSHVEFKTSKIHQRYYRFSGTVERGSGLEETDPDYLRLVGDLEIVTTKAGSNDEAVQRIHAVFKSIGKNEREE